MVRFVSDARQSWIILDILNKAVLVSKILWRRLLHIDGEVSILASGIRVGPAYSSRDKIVAMYGDGSQLTRP